MGTYYATLDLAKDEVKATGTQYDTMLLRYIHEVSRRVDLIMGNPRVEWFGPWYDTRQIEVNGARVNSSLDIFNLPWDLLELETVLLHTTDITATTQVYPPYPTPYYALQRTSAGVGWYYPYSSRPPTFVTVTGVFGYHHDYSRAWETVTTMTASINASVTSVAVVDGTTLQPGALIRLGDEYMIVTAISTNTLTVKRGANGTTAAAHDGTVTPVDVELYHIEDNIQRIVYRQAALLYARRGAFEEAKIDGIGITSYPQDMLVELATVLTEYQCR